MDNNSKNNNELKFPDGFLWGTSMSAYQVEGGNTNDWSVWEKSAQRLKELMKKKKFSEDFICAGACDFWNRYESDFNLAKSLNNNAVRIGLEWSRIEPQKNNVDVAVINHYKKILRTAKEKGLTTMVTLWHWTNPVWFTEEGGWQNKKATDYFSRYTSLIVKELGGDIDLWTTLNEPMAFVGFGYIIGKHPPCKKWHFFKANKIFNNLVKAHKCAYKIIHHHFPNAKVSFNSLTDYFEPYIKWDPFHNLLVRFAKYLHHGRFLNKSKKYLDYFAVNYYFHNRISYLPPFKMNKNRKLTDMHWEIYPKGIYHVLKFYQQFKNVPIYITENGIADKNDEKRAKFITDHLRYIHQAIQEGVDVRGYFHWSLLDNFEWAWGFGPKFGLYAVDRTTMERIPRASAAVYAEICKKNCLKI